MIEYRNRETGAAGAPELRILPGAVNTGLLRVGGKALLIDCCDSVTPARLRKLGVRQVDWICCTQPRRANVAGAYALAARGTKLAVAEAARRLYEAPESYWQRWQSRWECMTFQPVPEVPVSPLPVGRTLTDGETLEWENCRIQTIALPGPIFGALAFMIEVAGQRWLFLGDYLCAPGQFYELYPFQKAYGDTHGFCANPDELGQSLRKLLACEATRLVPSHGQVMENPRAAISLALERLAQVRTSYQVTGKGDASMGDVPRPSFLHRVLETTSFMVVSDSGAAILVDAGDDMVLWEMLRLRKSGLFSSLDAIYITHYHCDHLWAIGHLLFHFPDCQVLADERLGDIIRHPKRYAMPCVSHRLTPLTRTLADGESWAWHEFTLTNYYFPGQTLYHDALLVAGHGQRVLFTGDSFGSGLWMPDYCAQNRNFLGPGVGYRRCFDVLRQAQPDLLVEGHRGPFRWTLTQLEEKETALRERTALLTEMLPWEDPNFGLDAGWVSTYPYEQEVRAGLACQIDVRFTNHAAQPGTGTAALLLPSGWRLDARHSVATLTIPAKTEGCSHFRVTVPPGTTPGQYVIPARITWNGRYLGQIRHAIVEVY